MRSQWYVDIDKLAVRIRSGEIGVFPCDTIWGIVGLADPGVARRVQSIKKREADRPFLVLIGDFDGIEQIAGDVPYRIWPLLQRFWPGPLTVILEKHDQLDAVITGGRHSIGVRLPDYEPLNRLLHAVGKPLISTSLNISGTAHEGRLQLAKWQSRVDFVYDKVDPRLGIESTVVDGVASPFRLLRKGANADAVSAFLEVVG